MAIHRERSTNQKEKKRLTELDLAWVSVDPFDTIVGCSVGFSDRGLVVGLFVGVPILLVRVGAGVFIRWEGRLVGSFTVGTSRGPGVGNLVGSIIQYSPVAST